MLDQAMLDNLKRMAKAVATQFGSSCEVVVHEISEKSAYSSIVAIENGHISGRKVGDGPSHVVLEHLGQLNDQVADQLSYLTRTPDGKVLKSSSIYIRDANGKVCAIFSINFDITTFTMIERTVHSMIMVDDANQKEPERITLSVSDLLDDLIRQADELVGKPVALMTKEDKIRAIQFLNKSGALLITKSGDKISRHFGISKYTLYSYLDSKREVSDT